MLNTSQFFGNLVSQYVDRYNSIAERFGGYRAPSSSVGSTAPNSTAPNQGAAPQTINTPVRDSAVLGQAPTLEAPVTDTSRANQDIFESLNPQTPLGESGSLGAISDTTEPTEPTENHDSAGSSEKATYSSSFTQLRYKMKLGFDMQAIERTVHQLSVNQTADSTTTDESFERLFAGSFNFNADLKISGLSINTSATTDSSAIEKYRHSESIEHGRGLQRAASRTKQSLPEDARGNYQVAVNKFSLRYKTDSQFSMNHFSRFQSHVEQIGETSPESVGSYSDQAGHLAQSAPNEVVGQFFDTVDGYLETKEANLIENAERFFDMAGESLGLSAEAIATAKASVTNTIESFFDSAESNLATLQSKFIGSGEPAATGAAESLTQNPASIDGSKLTELTQPSEAPTEDEHSLISDLLTVMEALNDDKAEKKAERSEEGHHGVESKDSKEDSEHEHLRDS